MDDQESLFLEKLAVARTYPGSLAHQDEHRSTIQTWREHYAANAARVFDAAASRMDWPLVVIDFGHVPDGDKERAPKKTKVHIIRDALGLRSKFSWPKPSMGPVGFARDPALRVVLLERLSSTSSLLNTDEGTMMDLLTYHQVPSYFLNFLTGGGEKWSYANSMRFAGFRGATSLRGKHGLGVGRLGRSGCHIQLCLTLFSIREYPLHVLPRDVDPAKTPRWETHSAVVYLHFDVVEGTAVWFLVSPRAHHPVQGKGTLNLLWNELKESLSGALQELGGLDVSGRFQVGLECLVAVAEWAVGELSPHLQDLETRLSGLTMPYLRPFDEMGPDEPQDAIHEQDLRRMAFLMEQRHEGVMKVENNLRVLRRLRKFLVDEVSRALVNSRLRHADEMRRHIDEFGSKLSLAMEEMEDLIDRAEALNRLAGNREQHIQRMQTHHSTQQMKTIAELTRDDSSAMKQLSLIALFLLPVTVVSTILSTDIVKFQDLSNENEAAGDGGSGGRTEHQGAPVPVYSFSVAAFGTWAVASVVMTVVTLAVVKPLGSGGGRMRMSRLRHRRISYPWRSVVGGVLGISAEQEGQEGVRATPSESSPAAGSVHTAPAVSKTASHSLGTPVVEGVGGGTVRAEASQTLMRWLELAWGTLWWRRQQQRQRRATGLPR